jgi:hypothetical protein
MSEPEIVQQEVEYSKGWALTNPALFAASFVRFAEEHPPSEWAVSLHTTQGFITVLAVRRVV